MTFANSLNLISSASSAFGETITVNPTAIVQLQFPYNINTDLVKTTLTGSGTVTQANSMAVLQSGAASSSSATLNSIASVHYPSGQGISTVFTTVFSTGVANNKQIVGIGNDVDGFFFGYSGNTFGIIHRKNSSDTFIAQSTWNKIKLDGTGPVTMVLDPTKGNVYKIQFQWLGFGNIRFYIENKDTGLFLLVHEILYTNTNTTPSLGNPNLFLFAANTNTSNTSNITLSIGSMGVFVEGTVQNIDSRNAISSSKTGLITEVNVLTLRNNSTYVSKTNRSELFVDQISILNQSTQEGIFRFYLNPTVGGSPSFTDINSNTSIAAYDTAGTTVTGGRLLMVFHLAGDQSFSTSLESYKLRLYPGDRLVCSAASLGIALSLAVSLSWVERL